VVGVANVSPSVVLLDPGEGLLGSEAAGVSVGRRGLNLYGGQFYAVLVRRVLHTRGAVVPLLVQNILPLFVVIVGLLIAMALQRVPNAPLLELSPHMFFTSGDYNYMFVGGDYNNVTAPMADSFFQPCGVGAHAVGVATDPTSQCFQDNQWQPWQYQCPSSNYPQEQYNCRCPADMASSCNRSNLVLGRVPECFNGTRTGTRVVNVSLSDDEDFSGELQDYLLRSTYSFVRERYGGASFGHVREDVTSDVDQLNSDPSLTLPFLASYKSAKAWHTLKGYHAAPAFLNTLNNAILRGSLTNVSDQEQAQYGEFHSPLHPSPPGLALVNLSQSVAISTRTSSSQLSQSIAISTRTSSSQPQSVSSYLLFLSGEVRGVSLRVACEA